MVKKSLSILGLTGLLILGLNLINGKTLRTEPNGFEEGAYDYNNAAPLVLHNAFIGTEEGNEEVSYSRVFAQSGFDSDNNYWVRFATAVRGDIEKISYTRGAVGNKAAVTKEVTSVYRSISDNGVATYFDGTNLSTDEADAGKYYWACYSIKISDSRYYTAGISMSINIDGVDVGARSTSLDCLRDIHLFGFDKEYAIGDTFSADDLHYTCDCESKRELEIENEPTETLKLGDKVTVNGKDVIIPVKDTFVDYANTWTKSNFSSGTSYVSGFLKFEAGKANSSRYLTNGIVAHDGSFDIIFEARAGAKTKANHSEVTLRKGSTYEIKIAFESEGDTDATRKHYISSNYRLVDAEAPRYEVGYDWHTYRVSVSKVNGVYTYDVYMDDIAEPILSNIIAGTPKQATDLIKIGVDDHNKAGDSNSIYFAMRYLKLQ